jgi:hypothetical protein
MYRWGEYRKKKFNPNVLHIKVKPKNYEDQCNGQNYYLDKGEILVFSKNNVILIYNRCMGLTDSLTYQNSKVLPEDLENRKFAHL